MLTLTIEDIDYDTEACKLSLKGRNIEENPHVKMGAYHRLDLEMNRSVIYFITLILITLETKYVIIILHSLY